MFHLTTALDAASGVPLYEQLYESLAAEMRSGVIPAGTRMPGKRRLAAELSVSVNTVDAAYQILATEGYMEPRERSGFYVQEYLALPTRPEEVPPPVSAAPPEAAEPPVRFDLSTRGVDPGLFPFRTWARLQKELLYSSPQLLTHGDAQGDMELRQALADYLEEYRGVRCTAEQVVVGAGMEYLLSLLAPLLPGKTAVENPGYQRAKQVLENNGVACCCLPVDADGLSVEALSGSGAAVCYVTPSHQFPTGVTMPAGRRTELLHWASRCPGQRYIIEDDYDSEFRFDTRPCPACRAWPGPTDRWSTFPPAPAVWPPASASPTWCCPGSCCPPGGQSTGSIPAPSAGLSSRPWPASSARATLPGILPGSAWPTRPGGMLWLPLCALLLRRTS